MTHLSTFLLWLAGILGLGLVAFFFFFLFCLNHTSINEIGVAYNSYDGAITIQDQPGWYYTNGFTRVAYLSTLPMKITIPSEARVIMTKIVVFQPKGVKEFIRLQGFSYNLNSSLENILMGYAFSGQEYPFMKILQASDTEDATNLRPLETN